MEKTDSLSTVLSTQRRVRQYRTIETAKQYTVCLRSEWTLPAGINQKGEPSPINLIPLTPTRLHTYSTFCYYELVQVLAGR